MTEDERKRLELEKDILFILLDYHVSNRHNFKDVSEREHLAIIDEMLDAINLVRKKIKNDDDNRKK